MAIETGRRLCLLFEAGRARYAVEATAVVEVSPPDADGEKLRGLFELKDLCLLFEGTKEARPGLAVVLDVSPTLAVRVRRVVEVADVAQAPFFNLPPGLSERLNAFVRGAVLHQGRLYLELSSDGLAGTGFEPPPRAPQKELHVLEAPPDRGLIFESQGRRFGLPLGLVLQVVPPDEAFCPLPGEGGPVAGLLAHGQALWPVYSVPGLMDGEARRETLVVLADLAGHPVAVCAERVLGVHAGLVPAGKPGEFEGASTQGSALFLDFQRIFS